MQTESFDGYWPLSRKESKRYISEEKIENVWLTAYAAKEFAIGFDLVSGGQCVLATAGEKPIKFRQFEGAHKELFSLGVLEFEVNAEDWDIDRAYNRFKAQYAVRKNRD